ncbi:MAG: type II toxin-antitoxin system RelE/ParE family toxin [Solirubrobacteraceae bacterium]
MERKRRELRLTAEVSEWLTTLTPDTVSRVAAGMDRVRSAGPTRGRPDVDRIKGSRHHNMKELRLGTIRVLFIFDQSDPLMLLGGDKRGAWNDWYRQNVAKADRLYDQYRRDDGKGGSSRHRNPPSHGR